MPTAATTSTSEKRGLRSASGVGKGRPAVVMATAGSGCAPGGYLWCSTSHPPRGHPDFGGLIRAFRLPPADGDGRWSRNGGLHVPLGVADHSRLVTIAELIPTLRTAGVRAVSPNGVLGDPSGASADEGDELLRSLDSQLLALVSRWMLAPPS